MTEFFEGKSRSEAVINACTELEVSRSELQYEVVSELGEGLARRVRIRVLGATPQEKQSAAIDYPTALLPLRQHIEQPACLTIDGVREKVAFVDFDWLREKDEAFWQTMEHDGDRAMQLSRLLAGHLPHQRLFEDGLWGICAAVGVPGDYWLEYGFEGSNLHGLLILDQRERVGDSCPVLYVTYGPEAPRVLGRSAAELAVERTAKRDWGR